MQDRTRAGKRAHPFGKKANAFIVGELARYQIPQGVIGLTGPVERPDAGTLPLRGDLAHIALAGRFLAAHYVVPLCRTVGPRDVVLKLNMRDDAEDGAAIPAGSTIEVLDTAGNWVWVACGPQGPSGYLHTGSLAEDHAA